MKNRNVMQKQDIYAYLKTKNIRHEIIEHKAVYNMEEDSKLQLPYPEADGKNLFIRDDKKRNYYLLTVKGDKKVNLKAFREKNHTRALSFAPEHDLMDMLGVTAGAVTPFGLLNDSERKVQFCIDKDLFGGSHMIGVHPNDNTATVYLKVEDLICIIEEHGNQIYVVEF